MLKVEMNRFLVIFVVTCYFSQYVKSDTSSSEEDSDESSESLFGKENDLNENDIKPEDKVECIDFIKIEDVESCFANQCKAECVAANLNLAANLKVGEASQYVPDSCSWGCINQISTFKAAQAAYHKTSAELLLGTAVDKCWDGCIERSDAYASDQKSCISGCETMRKIQRQQLRSKVETNNEIEKTDESEEIKEVANDDLQDMEQNQEEPAHVVRTYVLWHPMDQEHAYQTYNVMMSIVQRMFQEMDDMDHIDDDKQMTGGWKDDRRQLRIPQYQPRVSALTSDDETSEVYNKVVDSLDSLKDKIQETISQPEFKENLFYCLMTICCFLLLTALYDNCTEDPAAESEEDHYTLADTATIVKLPSYDDCIKADKYLAVDIKDVKNMEDPGEMTKADLSLSFSVVLDDEDPLHK